LDKEIKEVLEDYSQDGEKLKLLTGRRVVLAEEFSKFVVSCLTLANMLPTVQSSIQACFWQTDFS